MNANGEPWPRPIGCLLLLLAQLCSTTIRGATPNVIAWGNNTYEQTNVPADLTNAVSVDVGYSHCLALRADGTVVGWGTGFSAPPHALSNVVAIASASACVDLSLAVLADGRVVAWPGELPIPASFTNLIRASPGLGGILAVRSDGSLATTTRWLDRDSNPQAELENTVEFEWCQVLRADGTVLAWDPFLGSSEIRGSPPNFVALEGLRADGTVDGSTMLGVTNIVAVSSALGLRSDGTITPLSTNVPLPSVPLGLSNVVALAGGGPFPYLAVIGRGPPVLTAHLSDRKAFVGGTCYWRIAASGDWPLSYQWLFNGTNLPAATNAVLVVGNATAEAGGVYSVIVSNALGTVSSPSASLCVVPALLNTQPRSLEVWQGSNVTFAVEAHAAGELNYQWRCNGTNIAGATSATLTLPNVSPGQAGSYSAIVSNVWGAVISSEAQLKVMVPYVFVSDPLVGQMIASVHRCDVVSSMRHLTGREAVLIRGETYAITNRFTASGTPIDKATQWAFEQFHTLDLHPQFQPWESRSYPVTNRNIIGILPGSVHPQEVVVVGAHLDAEDGTEGAEDNASGCAAVLMAARVLSQYGFDRSLQFVLFTGEELGLLGSRHYAADAASGGTNIVAALVPDLIAGSPNTNRYGCGSKVRPPCCGLASPGDEQIAAAFINVVESYGLAEDLHPAVSPLGMDGGTSDQTSLWDAAFPAVWIEDVGGAGPIHTPEDTLSMVDFEYLTSMVKAIVGTAAQLAQPIGSTGFSALELGNGDWNPGSGIGGASFVVKFQNGACETGPDSYDVAWPNVTTNSSPKWLRAQTAPYGVPLQVDARPPNSEIMFHVSLLVGDATGDGVSCGNSLRFRFLTPPDPTRVYLARIHIDGRYTRGAADFDCITNLQQVIASGGFLHLPNLAEVPNGTEYGSCDIFVRSLSTDPAHCQLAIASFSEQSLAFTTSVQLGTYIIDEFEVTTNLTSASNWTVLYSQTNYIVPDAAHLDAGWKEVTHPIDSSLIASSSSQFFRLKRIWRALDLP